MKINTLTTAHLKHTFCLCAVEFTKRKHTTLVRLAPEALLSAANQALTIIGLNVGEQHLVGYTQTTAIGSRSAEHHQLS